jgi:hypothetical protein
VKFLPLYMFEVWLCRISTNATMPPNTYFNNPPALRVKGHTFFYSPTKYNLIYASELTVPCCDNCIRSKKGDPNAVLTKQEEDILELIRHIETHIKTNNEPEIIDVDSSDIESAPQALKKEGQHHGDQLQHCCKTIEHWHSQCWRQHYDRSAWRPRALMSDAVVTKLTTCAHIKTLDTLRMEVLEWDFADRYGTDVLMIIRDADSHYKQWL